MSSRIHPTDYVRAPPGNVRGGTLSECPVNTRLRTCASDVVAPANPSPFERGRIEFPEVIEKAAVVLRIETAPSKEPKITAAIDPGARAVSCAGNIDLEGTPNVP